METLKKIICNYVDVAPSQIKEDMSLNAELGLDSFSLVSMLLDIEDHFNVEIPTAVLPQFQTLNDLYAYIIEHKA